MDKIKKMFVSGIGIENADIKVLGQSWWSCYYPIDNEVAKGYSNATVRPSFRNILVNTLESTSFNGFWPNLVYT